MYWTSLLLFHYCWWPINQQSFGIFSNVLIIICQRLKRHKTLRDINIWRIFLIWCSFYRHIYKSRGSTQRTTTIEWNFSHVWWLKLITSIVWKQSHYWKHAETNFHLIEHQEELDWKILDFHRIDRLYFHNFYYNR